MLKTSVTNNLISR